MAINDMIMPGVKNPLLAMAEEIRKQISAKAMEQPKTSPPVAGMPEDRDYTEGMQRPDLTKLKAEREFKATPSRTSAFLVALGNILQDKQNLEAAKQQTEQNEYNAKLADAMEMNKLFKTGKMKREFDESDPDTQLKREAFQTEQEHKKKMYPLEEKKAQAYIDKLLKGGSGGRSGSGGETISGGSGDTYLDQRIESEAWDYSQKYNTSIEDARLAVANNMKSKAGKNASLRGALDTYIKSNTVDPVKQRLKEAQAKIAEEKLKLIENPDPIDQAAKLQQLKAREANLNALAQDYGPEIIEGDPNEIVKKYAPIKPTTSTKTDEKIIKGVKYKKTEGGWKKVK